MLNLWKTIRTIHFSGLHEIWEADGGRRRDYLSAETQLMLLLGITAVGASPPSWAPYPEVPAYLSKLGAHRVQDYRNAHRLFCLLEAAVKAEDEQLEHARAD